MISMNNCTMIKQDIINTEDIRLNYQDAIKSPCASCKTSPCCTHLPLRTFQLTKLIDLDHAVYLLNFERIELGLSSSGEWSVYYNYPCRFINIPDYTCKIHNDPEQPKICVHYNPYGCWYKSALSKDLSPDFLTINKERLDFIISKIIFDEYRNIIEAPDWEVMVDGLKNIPLIPDTHKAIESEEDPVYKEWEDLVLKGYSGNVKRDNIYTYDALHDPCNNCQSYCCKTLVFPQAIPVSSVNLDYFKFCLGFPGIELSISDNMWSIIVRTNCQQLSNNRCSIYKTPQRPILCSYYDAQNCAYKFQIGMPRPQGSLRINLNQFDWLIECIGFDETGAIVHLPGTEDIRRNIEDRLRSIKN